MGFFWVAPVTVYVCRLIIIMKRKGIFYYLCACYNSITCTYFCTPSSSSWLLNKCTLLSSVSWTRFLWVIPLRVLEQRTRTGWDEFAAMHRKLWAGTIEGHVMCRTYTRSSMWCLGCAQKRLLAYIPAQVPSPLFSPAAGKTGVSISHNSFNELNPSWFHF